MSTAADSGRRAGRRGLATAVVICAAGAALALLAVTRTWTTSVQRQAAPLPDKVVAHTGASLLGWVPALALVGLAGAGALLATRGRWRTATGVVVLVSGLGVVAGGIDGLVTAPGAWPVFVAIGGFAIARAGLTTVRNGSHWPAMGTRYERPATGVREAAAGAPDPAAPEGEPHTAAAQPRRTHASMWDDLDRGVDPTDE
ncbi:MAG TPA: Trp biosynthesis-associated membrane protein [Micromonosporaceae bacterium]